jgi:hypothetical protein
VYLNYTGIEKLGHLGHLGHLSHQDRTARFGRTLAYAYLQPENLLLNAEMIRRVALS